MSKHYPIPEFSEDLQKQMSAYGVAPIRASRDAIKLAKPVPVGGIANSYARYYTFHLDFESKKVDGFNINEHTSRYSRATIWLRRDELELLLAFEQELNQLLQSDALVADANKKED